MKHRWLFVAMLVATVLLVIASCSLTSVRSSDQDLSGRMLVWHTLNRNETEAFNQVIQSFTALHPDVKISVQVFSTTVELNDQFINAASAGLGPDLVLAPSSSAQPLIHAGVIAPIDSYLSEAVTARFNPAVLAMLQSNGKTYGLPQALDTEALYVNRQLVEAPATDLATLLEQTNNGTIALIPINFIDAFWGIRAFGGQLFDEESRTVLDQGGFANWLAWLRDARNAPGMIQDTNRDALRQRFIAGEAGYYIGYASELNEILSALGAANVDVLSLPNGPVGRAGPLVTAQAFFFSSVSSGNQRLLATELAKFVTNTEQSNRLMRTVRQVPANVNVRINPRLYPVVASFVTQARNGIPKPVLPQFDAVVRLGNEAYVRTLEGGESPADVAFAVNNSINEANGFDVRPEPDYTCTKLGTIQLDHIWEQPAAADALQQIATDFHARCPLVIVAARPATSTSLPHALTAATGPRNAVAVGMVNQVQLAELLTPEPRLNALDDAVSAEMLQRFAPIAIRAMRAQGNLYALPVALRTDALYYNRALVTTAAQTLDDLRTQAAAGIPISLDTRFEQAFWGLSAFGSTQFFADSGAAVIEQSGMVDWLTWLRDARDGSGIRLSDDGDELLRRFLAGESAYYVGNADEVAMLREGLGDNLGVTFLPNGPGGPARPLVDVDGLVMRSDVSQVDEALALELMRFVTDAPTQMHLMEEGNKIPANGSVATADNPVFSVFYEQAQTGVLRPATANWQTFVRLGGAAYRAVLEEGQDPATVVSELNAAVNDANGIVVKPTPMPTPTVSTPMEAPTEPVTGTTEISPTGTAGDAAVDE